MRTFGRAKGGARRKAKRSETPLLLATLSAIDGDFRAGLVNVSTEGAQFTAPDLPNSGEHVIFSAETVQALARVTWSYDRQCGIEFEAFIPPADANRLRKLAKLGAHAA